MSEKVFITGVSSGLGRGLAEAYLERGAEVFGCSRRGPEDLVARGLRHRSVDLSLGEVPEAVDPFRELIAGAEGWDAVFLNAGRLGEIRDMVDTPLTDLRQTMEINVWANKWILDLFFAESGLVRQVVAISSGSIPVREPGMERLQRFESGLEHVCETLRRRAAGNSFHRLGPGPRGEWNAGLPDLPAGG